MPPDPDSWIRIREFFMRTPDSHRIRTVQYGSTPPVPIGPFSCVCKGNRHLDHPWGTGYAMPVTGPNANQVRQDPPNPLVYYQLTMLAYHYHCGNSPEPSLSGRSSMSAWLGGLGGFIRKGVWMPGQCSMLICLCSETDKKYSDKQIITEIHFRNLTHSWEKSQCKKYLSYYFF